VVGISSARSDPYSPLVPGRYPHPGDVRMPGGIPKWGVDPEKPSAPMRSEGPPPPRRERGLGWWFVVVVAAAVALFMVVLMVGLGICEAATDSQCM
jgi:hypothetical protein